MIALLAAVVLLAPQDPRVEATLSATTVRAGDAFVYQILVASDDAAPSRVGNPQLPRAFEVLRTQDFSETQLSFPGGRTRRFRREIVLVAHMPGTYTIPAAQIEIGGRHFTTSELQIVVTGTGGGESPAASGQPRLRVEFVPDTVYVGQQVLMRAEALIPEGRRPRRGRAPTFEAPQPTGFWTQDVPQSRQSSLRLIGAGVFEVHGFTRAYFPLSPGARALAPASVVYEARQDWLSGTRLERLTTADSLRLTVLPLPTADRPASFAGAVGRFTMETRLEPARVRAGEAATLYIEISGEGNVKGLPPPNLPAHDGVELMPAGDDAESWVSDGIIHGTRRFRWMLVPETGPAELRLGGIEFAYFDPHERRYRELRGEELRLDVLPGGPVAGGRLAAALEPPQPRTTSAPDRLRWVRSPAFLAVNALPLLALLGILGFRVRARRPARRPRSPDGALRAWRVRSSSAALSPDGLRRAFLRSIAEAVELPRAELGDATRLAARLRARGVSAATIAQVLDALDGLDEVRFAGGRWSDERRSSLVQRLDSGLRAVAHETRRRDTKTAAAMTVMATLLCAAAALPAAARQADLERGVGAFHAGDYDAAAVFFRAHLATAPDDATGWYNLGAAQLATGQSGAAMGSWLRVLATQPRDAEVRSRIAAAGGDRALRVVSPPLRLSADEALLLGSVLWLALLTGGGLVLAGRRRHGRIVAVAAAALLALHAGAAVLHGAQRARTAIALAEPTLLRAAPALRADELDRAGAGSVLRVVERRGGWLRVAAGSGHAWVDEGDVLRP